MSNSVSEKDLVDAFENPEDSDLTESDLLVWLESNDASAELIQLLLDCDQNYELVETDEPDLDRQVQANIARSPQMTPEQSLKLWEMVKRDATDAAEFDYWWDAWNALLENPNTDSVVITEIAELLISYAANAPQDWVEGFWNGVYEVLKVSSILTQDVKVALASANQILQTAYQPRI